MVYSHKRDGSQAFRASCASDLSFLVPERRGNIFVCENGVALSRAAEVSCLRRYSLSTEEHFSFHLLSCLPRKFYYSGIYCNQWCTSGFMCGLFDLSVEVYDLRESSNDVLFLCTSLKGLKLQWVSAEILIGYEATLPSVPVQCISLRPHAKVSRLFLNQIIVFSDEC